MAKADTFRVEELPPRPSWGQIVLVAAELAESRGEWAGYPIPIDDHRLVLEPRYPMPGMRGLKFAKDQKPESKIDGDVINSWECSKYPIRVTLMRTSAGRTQMYIGLGNSPGNRLKMQLDTFAACHVWRPEAEAQAMEKLREMVPSHIFQYYVMTGSFLETSPRSGVTYIFRRLRPTLAIRPGRDDKMVILAALCLHPIGYYEGTFAGVMVPTDEVIAHLTLMRGDEHGYWKKANQHSTLHPQAGI